MPETLATYYAAAQQEAQIREALLPFRELEWMVAELEPPDPQQRFTEVLTAATGLAIIAEHKRKSPNEGVLRADSDVAWRVKQYERGGALAVSVLTQEADFGGTPEDLKAARSVLKIPILRKDFIRTPYQLYEARAFGANAVLLIADGLTDTELLDLHKEASLIDLDCLVEVHDKDGLSRALEINPRLIGINNRDLETSEINLETARELVKKVPEGITVVAESGYDLKKDPEHMLGLRGLGIKAVLMGRSLMLAENPAEVLRPWTEAQIA